MRSWCFYWDDTGTTTIYNDGMIRVSGGNLRPGQAIPAGGTWVVGQDQDSVGGHFEVGETFNGGITNVNIYANFNVRAANTLGREVTRSTCEPKRYVNIVKTWKDFRLGMVGKLKVTQKSSC